MNRSFDAATFNRQLNHPRVYPSIAPNGVGALDLSAVVADERNYLLMNEEKTGSLFFHNIAQATYELHTVFLPLGRGRKALHDMRASLRWMFTRTDCEQLYTKVPVFNVLAKRLSEKVGAKVIFTRPDAWDGIGGIYAVEYLGMTYEEWTLLDGIVGLSGKEFHSKLELAKITAGVPPDTHDDDDIHDRYVGAAVETALGGQLDKAIKLYNRWANFVGYHPITLVRPNVVDTGDAMIMVGSDKYEILECRPAQS